MTFLVAGYFILNAIFGTYAWIADRSLHWPIGKTRELPQAFLVGCVLIGIALFGVFIALYMAFFTRRPREAPQPSSAIETVMKNGGASDYPQPEAARGGGP